MHIAVYAITDLRSCRAVIKALREADKLTDPPVLILPSVIWQAVISEYLYSGADFVPPYDVIDNVQIKVRAND